MHIHRRRRRRRLRRMRFMRHRWTKSHRNQLFSTECIVLSNEQKWFYKVTRPYSCHLNPLEKKNGLLLRAKIQWGNFAVYFFEIVFFYYYYLHGGKKIGPKLKLSWYSTIARVHHNVQKYKHLRGKKKYY